MLNLSDKDLDRFSKEAAEEYEPGEVLGPRSWDRLETRINQEFGRPGWNPIQHIRRFPFYYAPALLVLLGIGYYLVRPGSSSGSSPGRTTKASTEKVSVQPQNSVSDNNSSTPATSDATKKSPADEKDDRGANASVTRKANGGQEASAAGSTGGRTNEAGDTRVPAAGGAASESKDAGTGNGSRVSKAGSLVNPAGLSGSNRTTLGNGTRGAGSRRVGGLAAGGMAAGGVASGGGVSGGGVAGDKFAGGSAAGTAGRAVTPAERELSLSYVQSPHSLGMRNRISDSALRAFNEKSMGPGPVRKGIYEIKRNWQFGLLIAPDFTSVNSLAGDKAGSSIGITVDYMFAPHFYLGSGILATRKNYAARSQDYHAPASFYQGINGYVNYVKGSFYMMEIPLNLRYDFSVAGNTLFFISAGASSYLMTTENANVYWSHFNMDHCDPMDHLNIHPTNLFASLNVSAGVETGLSNSLSLLIAPYMKFPTKNMGLGQVEMNSVGINFALKFSPVTSRKRR